MPSPRPPSMLSPSPRTRKSLTLQHLFKIDADVDAILHSPSRSPSDHLLSMISISSQLFTFTNPSESPTSLDLKRHALLQILSSLRTAKFSVEPEILSPLVSMISTNLFRPLPPSALSCVYSDPLDDDAPAMALSPSWPHLHIIYDILAIFIANADQTILRSHLDRSFLLNLLSLFQTEDPRERDRLKNICHQLYSKMTSERSFMRRAMKNTLLHFATEGERHCGVGELLEICGSIINGFAVPLKEEHKVFLFKVLIPLHKPKGMCLYHRQLSYCVTQLVIKEPELTLGVVRGILRYWPMTNCPKEVLLIGELEDLVEVMEAEEFDKVAVVLCSQIAKCLTSCNSQVSI